MGTKDAAQCKNKAKTIAKKARLKAAKAEDAGESGKWTLRHEDERGACGGATAALKRNGYTSRAW